MKLNRNNHARGALIAFLRIFYHENGVRRQRVLFQTWLPAKISVYVLPLIVIQVCSNET